MICLVIAAGLFILCSSNLYNYVLNGHGWEGLHGFVPKNATLSVDKYLDGLHGFITGGLTFFGGIFAARTLLLSMERFEQTKKEHSTTQFKDAVELLGSDNSTTRMGALVTLESLMHQDPETLGVRITNLIVAYVRQQGQDASLHDPKSFFYWNKPPENQTTPPERLKNKSIAPYEDIKLGLEILAKRKLSKELEAQIDFDLHQIDHDLFRTSHFDLPQVYKQKTKVKSYVRANLQKANLQGAYLQGAKLEGADLKRADLQGAYLQRADLQGAYLQGAYLREAKLYEAKLEGADLKGAKLEGADLRWAKLYGAKLKGAYLKGANLRWAKLYGAELYGADLREANLYEAHLQRADLREADLEGVMFDQTKYSLRTIWPQGFDPLARGGLGLVDDQDEFI